MAVPKAGGAREVLADGIPIVTAESRRFVYWTDRAMSGSTGPWAGGLRRVDKRGGAKAERVRVAGGGLPDVAWGTVGNGDEVWVRAGDALVRIPD